MYVYVCGGVWFMAQLGGGRHTWAQSAPILNVPGPEERVAAFVVCRTQLKSYGCELEIQQLEIQEVC